MTLKLERPRGRLWLIWWVILNECVMPWGRQGPQGADEEDGVAEALNIH